MADNNISGRLALITGASSGYNSPLPHQSLANTHYRIGAACAQDLAKHGVHLALTYSKNRSGIQTIVSDIYASSPEAAKLRISIHKVDVGVVDEISNLFKEIQEQHKTHVDILVSNAGHGKRIVDVWFVVHVISRM
jgi:3-oxoacyl-[acyl-carrier protein] reductase